MRQMLRSRPGIFQYQPFTDSRMPVINPVHDRDFKGECLTPELNGQQLSTCRRALVRSQQLKIGAGSGQSLSVADEGEFRRSPLLSGDEIIVRREIAEP